MRRSYRSDCIRTGASNNIQMKWQHGISIDESSNNNYPPAELLYNNVKDKLLAWKINTEAIVSDLRELRQQDSTYMDKATKF